MAAEQPAPFPTSLCPDPQVMPVNQDSRDPPAPLRSPAPSFTSKDSFLTAVSTPSSLDHEASVPLSPLPTSHTSSQTGLRKSVSVDSFVHYAREASSTVSTRPNRGNTSSALEPPRGLISGYRRGMDVPLTVNTRERGESVSSMKDGYQSSVAGDSDVDRSDILSGSVDRYGHSSLKSQDPTKSFIRGGELPLPSRTPTLSTTSSMSSILSSSTTSITQEGQSTSSLQGLPRQTPADSGRARSGSLGVYAPSSGRRIQINTHVNLVCVNVLLD